MELRLSRMLRSKESTIVKTATMANIPTVTPNKDKVVRVILDFKACQANRKLSYIWRKNFIPDAIGYVGPVKELKRYNDCRSMKNNLG